MNTDPESSDTFGVRFISRRLIILRNNLNRPDGSIKNYSAFMLRYSEISVIPFKTSSLQEVFISTIPFSTA